MWRSIELGAIVIGSAETDAAAAADASDAAARETDS